MRDPFKKKEYQRELVAMIKTSGGTITAKSKEFTEEFHTISKKNQNLLHLFCDQRDNYWLNIFDWEVWRSTHDPFLHKQTNWKQLPDNSLRNLFVPALLNELNFRNPFPEVIRLKKDVKQKMRKLLDKMEKAEGG